MRVHHFFVHEISSLPHFTRKHAPGSQDAKVLQQHLIKADIFIQSAPNKSKKSKAAVREHAQMG